MNRHFNCKPLLVLVCMLALVLVFAAVAEACPTCKDTLAQNDSHRQNLVRGYGYSIIFMLSMPFLIFASMSAYFYYLVVKDRRLKAKAATNSAAAPQPALVGASN